MAGFCFSEVFLSQGFVAAGSSTARLFFWCCSDIAVGRRHTDVVGVRLVGVCCCRSAHLLYMQLQRTRFARTSWTRLGLGSGLFGLG